MTMLDVRSTDIALPSWMLSVAEARELERLENARFYLVRVKGNAGIGEALICDPAKGGCGCQHEYLTLKCLPKPYQGIGSGLYGYWQTAGAAGAEAYLSPDERARVAALTERFGPMGTTPDLATSHPRMARALGVHERDRLWGAIALGVLEGISEAKARELASRINTRARQPVIRFK